MQTSAGGDFGGAWRRLEKKVGHSSISNPPLFSDSGFFLVFNSSPSPTDKMEGSGTPQGVTSSSADRMVGMEHSEVRYFTRYGLKSAMGMSCLDANWDLATTTTVINDLILRLGYVISMRVA